MVYSEEQEDLGPPVRELLQTVRQTFEEHQHQLDPQLQTERNAAGKIYYVSEALPFIAYWQGKPGTERRDEQIVVSHKGFERELKLLGRKALKQFLAGRGLKKLKNRQLRELVAYSQSKTRKMADANSVLEQALRLPRTFEQEVPEDYIDINGHMNMMYYTMICNQGMGHLLREIGLNRELFQVKQRGIFALRQVISYLNELKLGETVAVHSGLVAYDTKRFHLMHYLVNLTRPGVASTDERVGMYIDLTARKSTPFEPEILARLEQLYNSHAALNWQPELSGAIKLKGK